METNDLNLRIICRTCQSDSPEMELIFEASNNLDENLRIDEMLMECTSLQVLCEDGLPKYICQVCKTQLFSAYAFKKQCEKSYASFQETFNIPKNENATKRDYIQILDNTNQLLLTCCTCGKMFTTLDGLRCHKRIHTGHFFKCKECDKSYTRLAHLQRHEMAHDKKKAHMCKICNRILTRIEHLKRHLVTHLKDKPHVCAKCQRGFNRAEHLSSHSQKCSGAKVYSCDICNKAFSRKDSLDVHRQVHEGNMPVLPKIGNLDNIDEHYVEIDMDDKILSDNELSEEEYDLLDVEIEVRENVLVDVGKDLIKDEQPVTTIKQELDMETTFIDKSVQSENIILEGDTKAEVKDNYVDDEVNDSESVHSEYLPTKPKKRGRGRPRKHINKRPRGRPPSRKIKKECPHKEEGDDEPCEMCEDNKQDMNLDDNLLHICSICNKVFPRITYLKRHLNSHKIVKSYACDNCPKSFIKKAHLSQHMKSHVKSPLLPCDECDKIFRNVEHLTKHKERKHSGNEKLIGEKKFKCDVCEKAFTTEKYREVHMRSHTGEKTFKCRSCEKSFISKSHLTEHMKFHNDNSKKFLCSECGQRFIRNDYLVIHMRRHRGEKPFKCQYCGKGFPRTTDLTVHERYHTGEKTHLCTICGRGFGRAYNLTVHMRTHTGEKPYRCTYCDAAFAQGNDLKAHVRRHTGERFQCELCPETFLMGYLLTQHKRNVHGLNVVSNIRRLKPVTKLNSTGEPPITIPLPKPVIPTTINLPLNMV